MAAQFGDGARTSGPSSRTVDSSSQAGQRPVNAEDQESTGTTAS